MRTFFKWLETANLPQKSGRLVIVSGVHGDEKAPVRAMQRFMRESGDIEGVTFLPVANPAAFLKGTRCGKDHVDLNRQFCSLAEDRAKHLWGAVKNHKLLVTMHEWDGHGFFAYYSGPKVKSLAERLVKVGSKTFGIAEPNEKHLEPMRGGLLSHNDIKDFERNRCSLETYAKDNGMEYITTETPQSADLDERIQANLDLIRALVDRA